MTAEPDRKHHYQFLAQRADYGRLQIDMKTRMTSKPRIGGKEIRIGLSRLGLKKGDNVGVHSSLSAFGFVEGGPDTIVDALLDSVGTEGTVVMPTYSTNRVRFEVTEKETLLGVIAKEKVLAYDPEKEPCWTGAVAETFRQRKESVRSLNPTHSLAAIGPKADELCRGWDKLLEADGYMLLLGVSLANCSAMHLAEPRVPELPCSPDPPEQLRKLIAEYQADGIGIHVTYPGMLKYAKFEIMETPCKEHGIMREVRIGDATAQQARLAEMIDLYAQYLRKDPWMFYQPVE